MEHAVLRATVLALASFVTVLSGARTGAPVDIESTMRRDPVVPADSCDSVFVWSRAGWAEQEYTASLRQWDGDIPFPRSHLLMTLTELAAHVRFDAPLDVAILGEHTTDQITFDRTAVGNLATFGAHGLYAFDYESDGRLARPRVLVSSLSQLLDSAIVRAVRVTSDSAGLLPLPSTLASSAIELRLTLGTYTRRDSVAVSGTLFRARQPVFDRVTYAAADRQKQRAPGYPPEALDAGLEGDVDVEIVVRADGSVDPTSVLLSRATAAPFARDVLAAVLTSRFGPALIGGCPVPSIRTHPYSFTIRR